MKLTLLTVAFLAIAVTGVRADSIDVSNAIPGVSVTNAATIDYDKVDLTFSSSGSSYNGHNQVGIAPGISIDPIPALPNLWFGVSQGLNWTPSFSGSTDVDANWIFHLYGNFYIEPGWSGGNVYGGGVPDLWRTGPEISLQYYFNDTAYVIGTVDYDLITKTGNGSWATSGNNNGVRWSIGIGFEFGLVK